MELKAILESLIFASDKPLTLKQLKALTGSTRTEAIKAALDDIEAEFRMSGIQLAEVGGGYQFRTHPDCASYVKKLLAGRPPRLTQAMLETLAIVAYRQPITRPEIEDVRGVDCGGVLRLLLERALIRMLGKKEEVGRPILYGTTKQFLEFFNLKDLTQLPTLREFTELSEEMVGQLDPDESALIEGDADEPEVALAAAPQPAPATEAAPAAARPAPVQESPGAPTIVPAVVATDASASTEKETWTRAAVASSDEEDEDAALASLDRAMSKVDDILRTQRREERARLKALVGETAAAAAEAAAAAAEPQGPPQAAPEELSGSEPSLPDEPPLVPAD